MSTFRRLSDGLEELRGTLGLAFQAAAARRTGEACELLAEFRRDLRTLTGQTDELSVTLRQERRDHQGPRACEGVQREVA